MSSVNTTGLSDADHATVKAIKSAYTAPRSQAFPITAMSGVHRRGGTESKWTEFHIVNDKICPQGTVLSAEGMQHISRHLLSSHIDLNTLAFKSESQDERIKNLIESLDQPAPSPAGSACWCYDQYVHFIPKHSSPGGHAFKFTVVWDGAGRVVSRAPMPSQSGPSTLDGQGGSSIFCRHINPSDTPDGTRMGRRLGQSGASALNRSGQSRSSILRQPENVLASSDDPPPPYDQAMEIEFLERRLRALRSAQGSGSNGGTEIPRRPE